MPHHVHLYSYQQVQVSIASCLVPLAVVIKDDAQGIIDKLLDKVSLL